jgi:transposase
MDDARHDLTDGEWTTLSALLPPERPATGRPNKDHRMVVNAIVWRLRTGAPWRDLPARFGPWETAYSRFRRWQRTGVWDRVLADLQAAADADGAFDWALHFVDGTTIRAHPHAAGAKKGAPPTNRSTTRLVDPAADSRPNCICAPRDTANP